MADEVLDMTINERPLTDFGALLIDYDIGPAKADYTSYWKRFAPNPLISSIDITSKPIKIQYLFQNVSKTYVMESMSNLLKELSQATIKFNDADFYYDVILDGTISPPTWFGEIVDVSGTKWYRYTLEVTLVSGYMYVPVAHGESNYFFTPQSGNSVTQSIPIAGNCKTPLDMSFTIVSGATSPHNLYASVGLPSAFFDPTQAFVQNQFLMFGLQQGHTFEVNSEQFKVYYDGQVRPDMFLGDFPVSDAPLEQTPITLELSSIFSGEDNVIVKLGIDYKERYM